MSTNREILMKFITGQAEKMRQDVSMQGYKDDSPYRNNPSNTIYGSPEGTSITMEGVSTPLVGTDEFGNRQEMFPGQKYEYPGSRVVETPMAKYGGLLNKTIKCSNCGWSWKAADGGNDVGTCHKCGNKNTIMESDGEPKPGEKDFQKVMDWYNKYTTSPRYLENLIKSGYKDPQAIIDERLANINTTKFKHDESRLGSYYRNNKIHYSPIKDQENFPGDEPDSTFAHEFGHSSIDTGKSIFDGFKAGYNRYDFEQLKNRNKDPKNSRGEHENYADLKAIQYEAEKQGLYKAGYDEFTEEILDKLKDSGLKKRLLDNFSKKDIIWLQNNIAQNDDNKYELPVAQEGGEQEITDEELQKKIKEQHAQQIEYMNKLREEEKINDELKKKKQQEEYDLYRKENFNEKAIGERKKLFNQVINENENVSNLFHEEWMASPQYQKLLAESTKENNSFDLFNNIRNKNLQELKGKKINTSEDSFRSGALAYFDPSTRSINYPFDSNELNLSKTFFNDEVRSNLAHEKSHFIDNLFADGQKRIRLNSQSLRKEFKNREDDEVSAIPQKDVDLINQLKKLKTDDNKYNYDYYTEPTEVRARLNQIRENLHNSGNKEFLNRDLNEEDLKALYDNIDMSDHQYLKELDDYFGKENTIQLLNSVSQNDRVNNELPIAQEGANLNTPENWENSIRNIEHQIGNPNEWSIDDYRQLQKQINEYKFWRENTPEGKAVHDSHNEPNEYIVPLPNHLKMYKPLNMLEEVTPNYQLGGADEMSVSNKYQDAGTVKKPKLGAGKYYTTTGKVVTWGTPEYEKAYNRGEVLSEDGVRSEVTLDGGVLEDVVVQNNYKRNFWEKYRDKIIEEGEGSGLLGALFAVPINAVTSLPQLAMMNAVTGKVQRPSEAWGFETDEGWFDSASSFGKHLVNFGMDAATDPASWFGMSEVAAASRLSKAPQVLAKVPQALTKLKNIPTSIGPKLKQGLKTAGPSLESSVDNVGSSYPSFKKVTNAPENIDAQHLEGLIKKETDWLRSPEYVKRKKAATGRSEASIKKESENIINNINNTSIEYTGTYEDGASGLYSPNPGKNPQIRIFDGSPDYYGAGHPFYTGVLDHEVKHAFSETGTGGDPLLEFITGKGYKNYPKVNLNKNLSDKISSAFGMNWANLAPEQQVTGRRMMDVVENTQGVKRGTELTDSNIEGLIQNLKDNRFDNADMYHIALEFKKKFGDNYQKHLKDFLNKAYVGVPAAVTYKALEGQEEIPENKEGGLIEYQNAGTVNPTNIPEKNINTKEAAQRVVQIAEDRIRNNNYVTDIPQNVRDASAREGKEPFTCIGGVCTVLKEAGVMDKVDWSNTHFSEHAKEYGFTANQGWGVKGIENLEPGDVLQHNNKSNNEGNYYPGHSQIYLGKDASGQLRFFDNFWKTEKTYFEYEIKDLLDRSRKKTEPSATIYKVNPYDDSNPYGLTPEEKKNYDDKQEFIKKESASKASYKWNISPAAKNYNDTTKRVMDKFIAFANDNDKINDLVKKTGKSKEEIHDSLLNVFGELGAENNWTTSKGKGLGSRMENVAESVLTAFGGGKRLSVGPGQIKYNSIPQDLREKFNIQSPNDLYDLDKVLPLMAAMDLKDKQVLENWGKNNTLSKKLFGFTNPVETEWIEGRGTVPVGGGFTAEDLPSVKNDDSQLNNGIGRYSPYLRNQYSSIASGNTWEGGNDWIPFNEGTLPNFTEGQFTKSGQDEMRVKYERDPGSYPFKVEQNWRNNLNRFIETNADGQVELNEVEIIKPKKNKRS